MSLTRLRSYFQQNCSKVLSFLAKIFHFQQRCLFDFDPTIIINHYDFQYWQTILSKILLSKLQAKDLPPIISHVSTALQCRPSPPDHHSFLFPYIDQAAKSSPKFDWESWKLASRISWIDLALGVRENSPATNCTLSCRWRVIRLLTCTLSTLKLPRGASRPFLTAQSLQSLRWVS